MTNKNTNQTHACVGMSKKGPPQTLAFDSHSAGKKSASTPRLHLVSHFHSLFRPRLALSNLAEIRISIHAFASTAPTS